MSTFSKGFLFGMSLGLLFAPLRGQEMRRLVSERFQKLRGTLSENEQLNQYTEHIPERASQVASTLKNSADQVTAQVKKAAGRTSNAAQYTGLQVKQMGSSAVETATSETTQTQQSSQFSSSSPATPPTDTVRAGRTPSRGNPLGVVPGMEPEPLSRLEAQGISTTQQLLERTATKEEREALAHEIGMTTHMLRSLVDRADLMQLPGVGADMATLLEEAGVNGCKDLQHRNPEHLYATLTEVQGSGRSASHSPGREQISQWIAEATLVARATQE